MKKILKSNKIQKLVSTKHYNYSKKINKLLCANRGEIAIRVFRAATELGIKTVSIYTHEDRLHVHRYKADESYQVTGTSPVQAYLNIPGIIKIAKDNKVDAIHPGYGFLSENAEFAKACKEAGIIFIGPSVHILETLGDKTRAKEIAKKSNVQVVPGTAYGLASAEEAVEFVQKYGTPCILKAAFGGGGRGMRVVNKIEEVAELFELAKNEAQTVFGNGTVFIEKFIKNPRHVEVQLLGDSYGNVIHLFERDCSVQRRHQKVIEIAPAPNLPKKTRKNIIKDAVKIAKYVKYKNAGTAEFLVDVEGNHYFIEVNPRIQVEHTVTEEITGVDLVQSQIKVAEGKSLKEIGLEQKNISTRGYAIQCRVTTENPQKDFQNDFGKVQVYRPGEGMGIRLDSSSGFAGVVISPHYDSLLTKVTAKFLTFEGAREKLLRCLSEFRIRGVSTNIEFIQQVLKHPKFQEYDIDTGFIEKYPEVFQFNLPLDRGAKLLKYFGNSIVNGSQIVGVDPTLKPSKINPIIPASRAGTGWRKVFLEKGAKGFAKAVRDHKGCLLMDTTMRDAHQSLLATRMRTKDLLAAAPATSEKLGNLYSLENWGGATFDTSLRFNYECPWNRLELLREAIPNIPFQMLLRGANAVGYTSYPDNVVYKFCKVAREKGIDVFRVFDSLNYIENLKLGIDAVGNAGGIIEASVCYTGDILTSKKYNLEYYLKLIEELVNLDIHVLNIKDMAGLLKPEAARVLISAIRKEYPNLPIHVHTHDTANTGVASMLACAKNGADVVDVAMDAMSGLTSQPSMGAVIASLEGTELDTGIGLGDIQNLNDYWEQVRGNYRPFESGQLSAGSDVYFHEMPGGQYTNLLFQSKSLGLADRWPQVKKSYSEANDLLGDIIKVTPSSKVVGDLAQFMVTNGLSKSEVREKAKDLDFPSSVVDYFQGYLGIPQAGFPEPLRTNVIKELPKIETRPGATLDDFDFTKLEKELKEKYKGETIREVDLLSSVMYPKVFDDFMDFKKEYGDVSVIRTVDFIEPLEKDNEINVEIDKGKNLIISYKAKGLLNPETGERDVYFEFNGLPRVVKIKDLEAQKSVIRREKAEEGNEKQVGAPMPGGVVEVKVKVGDMVEKGNPIVTLSAMKMETIVRATVSGKIKRVLVKEKDELSPGDLLLEIE